MVVVRPNGARLSLRQRQPMQTVAQQAGPGEPLGLQTWLSAIASPGAGEALDKSPHLCSRSPASCNPSL